MSRSTASPATAQPLAAARPTQPIIRAMLEEIGKALNGKDEVIYKVLLAILAGGHILLEDMPGVGKTTLALAISRTLDLSCKRIQFTPDVLPTDVVGFNMYSKATDRFVFREGAAFCNLLLADEINRTSSKTQSALLELMEEGAVTIDGVTHPLPAPHIVIATQNPITCVGTQRLPESQLDRFLVRLGVSPRGSLALMQMAKASAFAQCRDHLLPDDIVYVAPDVFCHRMLMQGSAADAPALAEAAVRDILAATPLPWTD